MSSYVRWSIFIERWLSFCCWWRCCCRCRCHFWHCALHRSRILIRFRIRLIIDWTKTSENKMMRIKSIEHFYALFTEATRKDDNTMRKSERKKNRKKRFMRKTFHIVSSEVWERTRERALARAHALMSHIFRIRLNFVVCLFGCACFRYHSSVYRKICGDSKLLTIGWFRVASSTLKSICQKIFSSFSSRLFHSWMER